MTKIANSKQKSHALGRYLLHVGFKVTVYFQRNVLISLYLLLCEFS